MGYLPYLDMGTSDGRRQDRAQEGCKALRRRCCSQLVIVGSARSGSWGDLSWGHYLGRVMGLRAKVAFHNTSILALGQEKIYCIRHSDLSPPCQRMPHKYEGMFIRQQPASKHVKKCIFHVFCFFDGAFSRCLDSCHQARQQAITSNCMQQFATPPSPTRVFNTDRTDNNFQDMEQVDEACRQRSSEVPECCMHAHLLPHFQAVSGLTTLVPIIDPL